MVQDSGGEVAHPLANAMPSLAEPRVEIARTRERIGRAVTAVEQRVLEGLKG